MINTAKMYGRSYNDNGEYIGNKFRGTINWDEDNSYFNQVQPMLVQNKRWKMCYCCENTLSARKMKAAALKKVDFTEEMLWFCSLQCKTLYRLLYPNM